MPYATEVGGRRKHSHIYFAVDVHAPRHCPNAFVNYANCYRMYKILFGTD